MIYCYDKRHPLNSFEREIEIANRTGKVVLYDETIDEFVDLEGKIVDIQGQVLMTRTWAAQISEINEEIIRFGGIPLIDDENTQVIIDWPKYYQPERKAIILTGGDLIEEDNITALEKTFGSEIFIKTKDKNFSGIIPISLLRDSKCAFYKALQEHSKDDFIVSGKVDIIEDEFGKKEYRCFVINGKVANISRFTDNILHQIDPIILKRAQEIADIVKDIMPISYVVDLFEYQSNGSRKIDVVEFNPIQASGIYLYNSAITESSDILHSSLSSLPYETISKLNECVKKGSMINQREPLYKVPFSFAGDLRSIILTGKTGITFTDLPITSKAWASHEPIFGSFSFESITSDSALQSDLDLSKSDTNKKLRLELDKKDN